MEIDRRKPGKILSVVSVVCLCLALLLIGSGSAHAQLGDACEVPDNGTGTVTLPPAGCSFLSPQEVYMIIDGLPAGATIELASIRTGFFCRTPLGRGPCLVENGGGLGGQREVYDSFITFEMRGTGALSAFRRTVTFEVAVETHSAPRTPGDPVQAFDTEMFQMQGSLPPGDPDFDALQFRAGAGLGLPASFGHNSLADLGDGNFNVDRFFDIGYEIDFVGAPGSVLAGMSGTTARVSRLEARSVAPKKRCIVDDDGTGTATLPPPGCGYSSPRQVHMIIDGLPPGTVIELEPAYTDFTCPGGVCGAPGGNLGGQRETFDATLVLQLSGTGTLTGFRRTLRVPISVVTDSAPRTPGDPVQSFVAEIVNLAGNLTGDPDFTDFTITAGSANGLLGSGRTLLEDLGDGTFRVDSFFDMTYQIDFTGAPGSVLAGRSGSTQGSIRLETRRGRPDAVERDNGSGTTTLPPANSQYESLDSKNDLDIIDGLPPGTTLELVPRHHVFFCETVPCGQVGGALGGNVEAFDSTLNLEVTGTGALVGFRRFLAMPVVVETHSGPLASARGFDTDIFRLQGEILGDPDFSQLVLVAGTDNGLPSPGHTTLTDLGDGTFGVDSFFDISYRIDFVGAPGSALDGLSGSTQDEVRLTARNDPDAVTREITIVQVTDPSDATDFDFTGDLGSFSLDDDADPVLSEHLLFENLGAGFYDVIQTVPAGWPLLSLRCEDPDNGSSVDVAMSTAMIDLDLGESISCTFRNGVAMIFADGFESGDVTLWSNSVP